jgi:hypothetical protein
MAMTLVMTREEFIRFTKPEQLKYLLDALDAGVADYDSVQNYGPGARIAHHKSVRAQIRNAHILHRAKTMAWERPELGIRYEMVRNRPLFWMSERGRVSFKVVDKNLRHHNYPTQQALAFDAQRWPPDTDIAESAALWFPDALPPPATNLVAGYLMNDTETAHTVYLICPDGAGYAWYWPLTRADIVELMQAADRAATAAAEKIQRRPLPLRRKGVKKEPQKENQ